jgi:DNA-binding response OmpR family regulator
LIVTNLDKPSTRILLVEDDAAVGQSLQDALRRENYTVAWRDSGAAGIRYAREHDPHLIILDVRLPDGSGFDFCRQLRQLNLRQPILMLTARQEEMDKVLGLEMGADDYVTKPYGLRELLSRVRALLRRAYGELSSSGSELIYAADMVIDLTKSKVSRGDQTINLTPTEYRLFVYLARHPGQALTRSQILSGVWQGDGTVDSERTVNVYVRRLREKLELDPGRPSLILTVPGVGYRLTG